MNQNLFPFPRFGPLNPSQLPAFGPQTRPQLASLISRMLLLPPGTPFPFTEEERPFLTQATYDATARLRCLN